MGASKSAVGRVLGSGVVLGLGLLLGIPSMVSGAFAASEIAKVNSRAISKADLTSALSALSPTQRGSIFKDPASRKQVLSQIIDQEILVQEAEREKLDKDNEYQAALARFRKQYIVERLLSKNLGGKLTEAAARSYYNDHKIRYNTDQLHIQHILLGDESSAEQVLKQAQAPGADFQALAEKLSRDPSAKNNRGDVGFVSRDQFPESFTTAIFSAKAGSVIGPVRSDYGFHVVKVIERTTGRQMNYEEVELRVKSDLRKIATQDYVARVRKTAKISIDEKELQNL